jgi:3-oxoacyl-[acyl-carrier protein] reductase
MTNMVVKSAIVTGGAGGIGRAVAKRLARDGFCIAVNYSGNPEKAQTVVAEIESAGGIAISVKADVSVREDVERLFGESVAAFGSLAVVIHCAGIMPLLPISGGDVESFDKVVAINLRGCFSSSVIAKSFPNYVPYIATKAGVEGLVRVLANELHGRNITVNAVAPGPVATPLFLKGKSAEQVSEFGKLAPLERLGQPEDIADVVSFLAGPDGGWVNAQVLRANGGFA